MFVMKLSRGLKFWATGLHMKRSPLIALLSLAAILFATTAYTQEPDSSEVERARQSQEPLFYLDDLLRPEEPDPRDYRIRVQLHVIEETDGLFSSEFASALRSLGDVVLVTTEEGRDFELNAVVICEPQDCRNAPSYLLSLGLSIPMTAMDFLLMVSTANSEMPEDSKLSPFQISAISNAWHSGPYHFKHELGYWVNRWGVDVYQRGVREFIAELDTQCFEAHRLSGRHAEAVLSADSSLVTVIRNEFVERTGEGNLISGCGLALGRYYSP